MPLRLHLPKLHMNKAFKQPSIGTQSISGLEPYELDLKILSTSTAYTSIPCSDTAEDLALAKVPTDEAYIHDSKATI